MFIVMPVVIAWSVVNIQYSIGCLVVFLVWHHLQKVNKSSVRTFKRFFLQFPYFLIFLMFLNIQIDLIILKTYDQQFTLTTKKSLHIILNEVSYLLLTLITFRVRHSRSKMYIAHMRLCLCPSPHSHTTAQTDVTCGNGRGALQSCSIGQICNWCTGFIAMTTYTYVSF